MSVIPKAVIRAGHRTMYFATKDDAVAFLESTKKWRVEEWTMEEEAELWKKIKEDQIVEKLAGEGTLERK